MLTRSHDRKVAKQVNPALCQAIVTVYEPQIGHAHRPSADG
jgi:hypothetical protein